MSSEEAVEVIKANYPKGGYHDLCEALDVAINLLDNAFTKSELELLAQCLSNHLYQVGGLPHMVMSCANKLVKLIDSTEYDDNRIHRDCNNCKWDEDKLSGECYECIKGIQDWYEPKG